MAENSISAWCEKVINGPTGLKSFEYSEMALPVCDRDVAIAAWVIRCLANPDCEGSQVVLDAIAERREAVQNG